MAAASRGGGGGSVGRAGKAAGPTGTHVSPGGSSASTRTRGNGGRFPLHLAEQLRLEDVAGDREADQPLARRHVGELEVAQPVADDLAGLGELARRQRRLEVACRPLGHARLLGPRAGGRGVADEEHEPGPSPCTARSPACPARVWPAAGPRGGSGASTGRATGSFPSISNSATSDSVSGESPGGLAASGTSTVCEPNSYRSPRLKVVAERPQVVRPRLVDRGPGERAAGDRRRLLEHLDAVAAGQQVVVAAEPGGGPLFDRDLAAVDIADEDSFAVA